MNVLHVVPSFYPARVYGGPIESVYQLCRHLGNKGCTVKVITTDANGLDNVLEVEKDHEISLDSGLRVRYCHRVIRHSVSPTLLRLLPSYVSWADIVHLTAVYSFPTIPTLFFCGVLGKPLVWSPRGALQRWEGSTRPRLKAVWESICKAAAPAGMVLHVTSEQEACESRDRLPGVETVIIPNGIEILATVNHVDGGEILRLLYLGRLHPKKGIENLLAACQALDDDSNTRWTLTIAGEGDPAYAQALRAKIHDLKLSDRVKMVGRVEGDAKRELFGHADVVIVPSYTENFGMVVAEALTHGVPVIVSRGTPWHRVEEVGCGLWVANDERSLADAIRRISRMPLREMGRSGRAWMEKEFDWNRKAKEMAQIYGKLVGHP